jgi:hypothetical protein
VEAGAADSGTPGSGIAGSGAAVAVAARASSSIDKEITDRFESAVGLLLFGLFRHSAIEGKVEENKGRRKSGTGFFYDFGPKISLKKRKYASLANGNRRDENIKGSLDLLTLCFSNHCKMHSLGLVRNCKF